jgi:intein-encoded DNA endonuclease-like protein
LLDREKYVELAFQDDDLFLYFLAGFFDAEGSIYFHKKKVHGAFEFSLTNMNETLLRRIAERLSALGYNPTISQKRQNPDRALQRGIKNSSDFIWHVALWRYDDVVRLIRALPSRHQEKVAKIGIALRLEFRSESKDREIVVADWESLKRSIKKGCLEYIEFARQLFKMRNSSERME